MGDAHLSRSKLIGLVLTRLLIFIPVLFAFFFLPAGTFDYWEAWVLLAILLVPMLFVFIYLLRNAPDLLERRMRMRERQTQQKRVIAVSWIYFVLVYTLPGFDKRFGWSEVPTAVVLIADVFVLAGYSIIVLVMRENRYASRIIEVTEGQKVINTGPYALVRHPMYVGALLMYAVAPLALGSYWAFIPALALIPIIVLRIRNEEAVLSKELPGYTQYMQNTRYRLIPGIW